MKKIACLILPLVMMLGCSKEDLSPTDKLFGEAMDHLQEYNYEAAESSFDKLAELEPGVPWIAYNKAIAFETSLQYYDALHMYMLMANTYPGFANAHAGEWRILNKLGLHDDALKAAIKYNELIPLYPETKLLFAEALMKAGQARTCLKILDSALALGGDEAQIDMMRAQAYARDRQFDSAETAYQRGLAQGDLSYRAWIEAAEYLETAGMIDSAMAASAQSVKLAGETPSALWRHFELALRHSYFTTARQIRATLKVKGVPQQIQYAAEMWYEFARKDYGRSRKALTSYGMGISNNISLLFYEITIRGALLDEMTIISNVAAITAKLYKLEYDTEFRVLMTYLMAVEATKYVGDVVGLDHMEDVDEIYYNRPEYLIRMAQMYYGSGQHQEFKEYFNRCVRFQGRKPDWLAGLGDIYAKFPSLPNDTAFSYYDQALKIDPWYAPALEKGMKLALKLRQYDRVESLFKQYGAVVKIKPELLFTRAVALLKAGNSNDGFAQLQEAQSMLPENYNWVLPVRNDLAGRNETKLMIKIANWLTSTYSEYAEAQLAAAELLLISGESARAASDRALALEPDLMDALAMNARVLYSEGDTEQAIAILKDNLNTDRNHLMSNRYLGVFLAEVGRDPNKAQNYARNAVGLSYYDIYTWMDLCYVYHLVGRYDLAKGEGRKAMTKYPHRPEPLYWTGMSEYMLGEVEGVERLRKSIENGLQGELLKKAQEALARM